MPHDQMFPKWKHLIYRYGITRSPSCGSFCCLVIPLLRTSGKDEAMKGIPKTPVEFDYDLWTTEDGKCMVRIKATGEVTEVERTVMQVLRSEEKRFRRAMSLDQEADRDGISKPTILSEIRRATLTRAGQSTCGYPPLPRNAEYPPAVLSISWAIPLRGLSM